MRLKNSFKRITKSSRNKLVKSTFLLVNALILVGLSIFIISSKGSTANSNKSSLRLSSDVASENPLDEISGADIAVNIATLVRMDQATAVRNNADTVNTKLSIVANDSQVVAKPQIIDTELKSISDLKQYKVQSGDTIPVISKKFGLNDDSIRWSNGIEGDAVAVDTVLDIPPVNGLVYKVKAGDTADSLASEYSSNSGAIIAFNDAEITGLVKDQKIVIPNGKKSGGVVAAGSPRPIGSTPVVTNYGFGTRAIYGYNGYDYGYCTWYVANRRAEVGKAVPANLGNASTWKYLAQAAGIPTGSAPRKYAVAWPPPRDYYGHVAFVEEVYADGSVLISEMNVAGWNVKSTKVVSAQQASYYSYIY